MPHLPRPIELLAPARDLETAIAAIDHGADAVYIGAPRYGARSVAGVSLQDIAQITEYAHTFGVRIYVALNTIIYDHELCDVEALIWDIWRCGADALIVQDMALTLMQLPPIPLHASTQCDTIDPDDARQLEALGFEQIVLGRELNVEQIRRIKEVTSTPLEVFVHGALCVSYSGRCYLSQALTNRSANRGECSQQCRLPYDLIDSNGLKVISSEHLLSPKDLNRGDLLEALLQAGASSFKIEGRLKSISYVKNVTTYYRQQLDRIIKQYPHLYIRASKGRHTWTFTPDPSKSFNRGFTDYQFRLSQSKTERNPVVISPYTPKSLGEYLGGIKKSVQRQDKGMPTYRLTDPVELANGDGLLYVTPDGVVGGLKVNKAREDGFTPARTINIPKGSRIYRNFNQAFERELSGKSATRKLPIALRLSCVHWGLRLDVWSIDEPRLNCSCSLELTIERAKRFDAQRLRSELSKLGETDFVAHQVEIAFSGQEPFIPLSLLSELRRSTIQAFVRTLKISSRQLYSVTTRRMPSISREMLPKRPRLRGDYRANIANHLARKHYEALGYINPDMAYELSPKRNAELMCTKHCLKHYLGYCTRQTHSPLPYKEPLYLVQNGQKLRLAFDCKQCQMLIYND